MIIAKNNIIAWNALKSDGPFYCPECNEVVILKAGEKKIHHFAHKAESECQYRTNESIEHLTAKKAIYEYLIRQPNCTKCEMERPLGSVRPDISLYIDGKPVVIEIQNSDISIETIDKRMKEYSKRKIHVIWVLTKYLKEDEQGIIRVPTWIQHINNIYRKLYFCDGHNIMVGFLYDVQLYKEEFDGHGGYYYTAKQLKEISWMEEYLYLDKDFKPYKWNGLYIYL
jgi:competence protein CoiA